MPNLGPVNKLLLAEGAEVAEVASKRLLTKTGARFITNAATNTAKLEAVSGKLAKAVLAGEDAVQLQPRFGLIGKNRGYIPKANKFAELEAEVIGNPRFGRGKNGLHQYIRIRVLEVTGQAKAGAATGQAVGGVSGAVKSGAAAGQSVMGVKGVIEPGSKLTISHNVSIGADVSLKHGDKIVVRGMPFYNNSGRVTGIHWTHHARTPNDAGWIKPLASGIRFQ